ncbi:MAG: hypothetical protein KBA30_04075 [Clostridia bacterium]|nr:hypothetical protein [Clostridia bacterium]
MPMIHLFGASGAGTSTLGRAIADAYGCVHLDTDDFFWMPTDPPFTTTRPVPERLALIADAADRAGRCVLSGSLCGWGNPLVPRFDLAIWVQTPQEIRIGRLREREFRRFGDRILPDGDMHDNHKTFIEWARSYDTAGPDSRSRALHAMWADALPCPVMVSDGSAPLPEQLDRLAGHLLRILG